MELSKEEIITIGGDEVVESNIEGNPNYKWVDIVGIPQRPLDLKEKDNFYLTTYSSGEGGWDHGFDRRPTASKVAYDKGWHLGIEEGVETSSAEYMKVRNLDAFAQKLYDYSRSETNPYIVGVTGSVGKTNTVAFLEHLLKESNSDVVRFYSKRLTPLSVMCHYINRVEQATPFVVMEYSAYLREHVGKLSELLPPNIAFLTNIYDTHLNPGMFTNHTDILQSKLKIKPKASVGFINDNVVQQLGISRPDGWNGFEVTVPEYLSNNLLPPTLRTAELFTVGKLLAQELNIPESVLNRAYETYIPAEKRIRKVNYRGKDIYFHGETSGGSRLWSWFETYDQTAPWFMVDSIDFSEENPLGFKNLLEKVFESDKTYVLDTPQNREILPVKVQFVSDDIFNDIMRNKINGYVVYHKALANRQEGFNPEKYINARW